MKTVPHRKHDGNKNTFGSVISGIAGVTTAAVAITGVAVAAAMALTDDKTRKKAKKVLTNIKDYALDYVETLKTEPTIKEGTHTIKKIATDTKKVVEKNA